MLIEAGNLPAPAAQKCFKFLQKSKTPTLVCMKRNGDLLSPFETHKEWCFKLKGQCAGPVLPESSLLGRMRHSVNSHVS